MRYLYGILTMIILLSSTLSHAGTVDPALVGSWLTSKDDQAVGTKVRILWVIRPTGEASLNFVTEEIGFLITNPESWAVRTPNKPWDLAHGKYVVKSAHAFSTQEAGSPYDEIQWTRVPSGTRPSGIDPIFLDKVLAAPQEGLPQNPLNSALVGLWQASVVKDGIPLTLVWRISPNGHSIRVISSAEIKARVEADNGQLKIIPTDGPATEVTYQILHTNMLEMTDKEGTILWVRVGKKDSSKLQPSETTSAIVSPVEPAVAGTWELKVPNASGVARWIWEIRSDGTYNFRSEGPGSPAPHSGSITIKDGHWSLKSTGGYTDEGTYQLPDTNTLIATGNLGTGVWRRSSPIQTDIREPDRDDRSLSSPSKPRMGQPTMPERRSTSDAIQTQSSTLLNTEATTRARTLFEQGKELYLAGDYAAAAQRFLEAAKLGYDQAQLQVGYQYEYGEGVPQNYTEAARWYQLSARQGNATAQSNLGALYEDGKGVPEDWMTAAYWYALSARQGYDLGEFRLGRAYEYGMGVPQDRNTAIFWYDKAAAHGHAQAAYMARHLRQILSVTFRTEEERQLIGFRTYRDPKGRVFRNEAERFSYLMGERQANDAADAWLDYDSRKDEYDRCRNAGRSGCIEPMPPAFPRP